MPRFFVDFERVPKESIEDWKRFIGFIYGLKQCIKLVRYRLICGNILNHYQLHDIYNQKWLILLHKTLLFKKKNFFKYIKLKSKFKILTKIFGLTT